MGVNLGRLQIQVAKWLLDKWLPDEGLEIGVQLIPEGLKQLLCLGSFRKIVIASFGTLTADFFLINLQNNFTNIS